MVNIVFRKIAMCCLCYFIIIFLLTTIKIYCQNSQDFICIDGSVIQLDQICNGVRHCSDGSDELKKLCYHIICPANMFRCHYGACIEKQFRCDGIYQCADKSDESQCGKEKNSCEIDEFKCLSGDCILLSKLCDNKIDCGDESDESIDTCEEFPCPDNSYRCKHGGCIHLDAQCNGFKDCVDGSDESELLCDNLKCFGEKCKNKNIIICPPIQNIRITVTCELLANDKKGMIPCNKPLPIGAIAHYQCRPYYVAVNNVHINNTHTICQADGTWNREVLKCEPECGRAEPAVTPLVVQGWTVEKGKWPWHAIIYILENGSWTFSCGGSLISEQIVITAAHCTWNINSELMKVALAKHNSNFDKKEDFTQIIGVQQVIRHPLYQDVSGNYGSDLALIVLYDFVEFSPFVRPVCIDWKLHDITEHLTENSLGLVLGMGITENDTYSETLRATYLPIVSDNECIEKQTRDFKKYITYTSFCAGWENGTGVCNGDSGGGLIFPMSTNHKLWVLQGIVSVSPRRLGTAFCDPSHFTVFTKVGMYVEWLQNTITKIQTNHNQDYFSNIIV